MSLFVARARTCKIAIGSLRTPSRRASTIAEYSKSRGWPKYVIAVVPILGAVLGYKYLRPETSVDGLNPLCFTPFELVSKQYVSPTSSIFLLWPLHLEQRQTTYDDAWRRGIWSVQFKQPQLQIARAYTPLPPSPSLTEDPECAQELRFLIRKDPEGEVSSYLHDLEEGSILEARGPNLEYEIPSETERILFLAGGTGIAPALQAAHSVLEARKDGRRRFIHIMWANRRKGDCVGGRSDNAKAQASISWLSSLFRAPEKATLTNSRQKSHQGLIVRELEQLKAKHPGQISVDYFVDEEGTFIDKDCVNRSLERINPQGSIPDNVQNLILISGPDGFVSFLSGPKAWRDGKEVQGRLGGTLSKLNLEGWKLWKL